MKKLRIRWCAIVMMICLLCCACMAPAVAEQKGTVRGGWLILRSAPSYEGKQLSSYPTGTVVSILEKVGDWYHVKAPDGLKGYMLGRFLKITGEGGSLEIALGREAWVYSSNGMNVRLRSGPGTQYRAIASYAPGTKVEVIEQVGSFHKIKIGNLTGYMMSRYLTGTNPGDGGGSETYTVYVTSRNGLGVNLRSGPSTRYSIIGFFEVGTKATMIQRGNTWSKIYIGGREGYMMTTFLTRTKPETYESVFPVSGAYVYNPSGNRVNLRKGPGLDYKIIGSYSSGTSVTIVTKEGEWYFVRIGGTYGYMLKQYIVET